MGMPSLSLSPQPIMVECVTMAGVMEFVTIFCQPRVEMLTKSDARVVVGGIQWSNLHPTKDSPGELCGDAGDGVWGGVKVVMG